PGRQCRALPGQRPLRHHAARCSPHLPPRPPHRDPCRPRRSGAGNRIRVTAVSSPEKPDQPTPEHASVGALREAARAAHGWPGALRLLLASRLPRPADYAGLRRTWRGDLVAGLTVGIVALPLALGFGVASGVGAA